MGIFHNGRGAALSGIAGLLFAVLTGGMPLTASAAGHSKVIVAGSDHTCGLTATGTVMCWGSNSGGQLGIGAIGDRHTPTSVPGLSGVLSISAGADHTCVVTKGHGVMCWGNNDHGQLGTGDTTRQFSPVKVHGLSSGIAAVAAGGSHTCALTQTGAVKCWGENSSGQLGNGDGTAADKLVPVQVSGLTSGVSAIGANQSDSCALTVGQTIKCWGWNGAGQLGTGTKGGQSDLPVAVKQVAGVVALGVGGDHNCALTSGAVVTCWGENIVGELGDGNTSETNLPVRVKKISNPVLAIAAGGSHTCAMIEGGNLRCWGNNVYGMIGDGTQNVATTAVGVKHINSAKSITAGGNHSCAMGAHGRAKCWGQNEFGELGDGTAINRTTPVLVIGF